MYSDQVTHAKLAAKRQIGMLRAEINYRVSHGTATREDLEQSHSRLQQEISRARFVLRRLSTCLEAEGDDPCNCAEITSLQGLLEAAVTESSMLYQVLFSQQKKDSLRAFIQSVNDLIERGEASDWISRVRREDLINQGQEVNRLFQLLIEGQGSTAGGIPLIDSVTLARASERIDMFSPKQCESLRKRSTEVEDLMLEETERLARNLKEDEDSKQWIPPIASPRENVTSKSDWACEQCTFLNHEWIDRCEACHTIKQAQSFLEVAKRKPNKAIQKGTRASDTPGMKKVVIIKKAPARGSSTNTIWIRNKDVPELIGPGGKHQQALITQSGAISIYAFQERLDKDGMCPIEIQGSQEAFEKAVAILEKKFNQKAQPAKSHHIFNDTFTKETIWIRNTDVPDMIGPRGQTVQGLKAETGVKSITAWQERVDESGMCPIEIRGQPEAVKKAAAIIMNMFCGVPDTSRRLTRASASPPLLDTSRALTSESARNLPLPTSTRVQEMAHTNFESSGARGGIERISVANSLAIIPTTRMPLSRNSNEVKKPHMQQPERNIVPPNTTSLVCQPRAAAFQVSAPTNSSMTAVLKSTLGVASSNSPDDNDISLLNFLQQHEKCFSCVPHDFATWLESVQITSLEELAEALEDDDFVSLEMKANGLKYFKRFALQKAITASLKVPSPPQGTTSSGKNSGKVATCPSQDPPFELVCPIRHALMVTDPVLAPDGYTYEREAIEEWLQREGGTALSPMTQEPLVNATLVSNVHIRTMARDWYRTNHQL